MEEGEMEEGETEEGETEEAGWPQTISPLRCGRCWRI